MGKIRDAQGKENWFKVARYMQGHAGMGPQISVPIACRAFDLSGQRSVKRRAANAVTGCDGLWRFVIADQLPGTGHMLGRQFPLTPEFHTTGFCGLDAGTGSLADKAAPIPPVRQSSATWRGLSACQYRSLP